MGGIRFALILRVAFLGAFTWYFAKAAAAGIVLASHFATQGDILALLPLAPTVFFVGVANLTLRETIRGLRGGGPTAF